MSRIHDALQKIGRGQPGNLPSPAERPNVSVAPAIHKNGNGKAETNGKELLSPSEARHSFARESLRMVKVNPPVNVPVFPFGPDTLGAAEQYRMIRTRIVQALETSKLILVSSPESGDGKTTNAINIAGSLALRRDMNILLVDADMCRPTINRLLGIEASPGLSDVLQGNCSIEQAIVRIDRIPGLCIMPSGAIVDNRTELLDTPVWKDICATLRENFHYVIVDAPPIETVADYPLIQAACDRVVVVVRPDHTHRARCIHVLKAIPKEKLLGVVVNAAKNWFMLRNSHYPYYGYNGYYGSAYPPKK